MQEMTAEEWESLCDGCGKCCMAKLIDDDTDEIVFTTVACTLFDAHTCKCSDYSNRQQKVSDCVKLTPGNVAGIEWLPSTCGYRLVSEGQDLPEWHPLVSGSTDTVHAAGISMRGKVTAFEHDLAHDGEYLEHLSEDAM